MNDNFDSGANSDRIPTLDCEEVVASFGDLLENDLKADQERAVTKHLASCSHCAEFYASYKQVVDCAAELRLPEEPLPVDIQNRLRKALNQRLGINLTYIA